jgi:hypothetical protein
MVGLEMETEEDEEDGRRWGAGVERPHRMSKAM